MSHLDMQYIADLVLQAQDGSSNAFAELFAATFQKQFAFARDYLKDDFLAQTALQEAYILAMKHLYRLGQPELVVVWLNQITLTACFGVQRRYAASPADAPPENRVLSIGGRQYTVRQIMTLPFSECQALLLSRLCGMRLGGIASLLEIRRGAARRYMENGRKRLRQLSFEKAGDRP